MEGAGNLDNRRPTNWNDHIPDVEDIYHIIKLLIQLIHDHPDLANDRELEWIDHNESLIMHVIMTQKISISSLTAKNMI